MNFIRKSAAIFASILTLGTASTAGAFEQTGFLEEGDTAVYAVTLRAGSVYTFSAVGDRDALDIDLIMVDRWGYEIAMDIMDDAEPVIRFRAPATGTYRLRVTMTETYRGRPALFHVHDH